MDMKTRTPILAVAFFMVTQLMGCSTGQKISVANDYDKRSQHIAENKLSETATSISKSLAQLAEMERASHP
ncbi:MAG: hypothetical protein KKE11_02955, partial [Gammaproteobacteria bacterium]|nr:hypothetical protein [Gammaproteobacteria bacterium]